MSISEADVFGPELERARNTIDAHLDKFTQLDADCPPLLKEAIRYSVMSGGKRLRPLLVLSAAKACGGDLESAMPAACAVEMIHTYSLIHDDLPAMDDDDMRRGRPSCHVAFDEATAILAGDALIPLAFETLTSHLSETVAMRCVNELAKAAGPCHLVGGQSDDLRLQNAVIDQATLEAIHRRKTGALFVASLRLGGFCAQATPEQVNALTEYGKNLGLAFQVTDDLLDLYGDEDKIGKRVGKDSALGKRTYPEIIGVAASQKLAKDLRDRAVEAMRLFGEVGNDLVRFANFVVERNF